jgi:hypothetical protein
MAVSAPLGLQLYKEPAAITASAIIDKNFVEVFI